MKSKKKDTELQRRPGSSQLTLSPARTPAPSQPAGWSANLSTAPHSHWHLVQTMVASVPLALRVRLLPWSRMMGWWRLLRFGRPWLSLEVLFCYLNLQKCFEFSFIQIVDVFIDVSASAWDQDIRPYVNESKYVFVHVHALDWMKQAGLQDREVFSWRGAVCPKQESLLMLGVCSIDKFMRLVNKTREDSACFGWMSMKILIVK